MQIEDTFKTLVDHSTRFLVFNDIVLLTLEILTFTNVLSVF